MNKQRGFNQTSQFQKQQQQEIQQKFTLYKFLQLQQGPKSTPQDIRKKYKKLVIKYHPDKNQGDQKARQQFHKLKEAYDLLMDPQKKKLYDQTGIIDGNTNQKAFQSAYQYIRTLYKKVQLQDIQQFSKKYRYGQMEQQDLIEFYESHEGNVVQLLQCIPLSTNEDIPRFIQFYEKQIGQGKLKKLTAFTKTKNKVRLLADQSKQFEQEQTKKKQSFQDLVLAIRQKPKSSFLQALEAKYVQPPKKKKINEKKVGNKKRKKQV